MKNNKVVIPFERYRRDWEQDLSDWVGDKKIGFACAVVEGRIHDAGRAMLEVLNRVSESDNRVERRFLMGAIEGEIFGIAPDLAKYDELLAAAIEHYQILRAQGVADDPVPEQPYFIENLEL